MTMVAANYNSLLDPMVKKIYFEEFTQGVDMIPVLYGVESSDTYQEKIDGLVGLGSFPEFSGDLQYADLEKAYEKTFTHKRYAKGLAIERELVDDGLFRKIRSMTVGIGMAAYNTRQAHAAAPFNEAFSATNYTTPDGLALCSSAHTSNGTSADQSNTFAIALSASNLEIMRIAMMNFVTDDDQPANVVPDMLLVPPALIGLAREICQSLNKSNTANNDINIYNGEIIPVAWNRLTASGAFFLIDSRLMKMFNLWFERIPTEFKRTENFDQFTHKFAGYMRHSFGAADWRFIAGSTGA